MSVVKHQLVHETAHPALTDTNLARTKLGVGEEVGIRFEPTLPTNGTWLVTAGGLAMTSGPTNLFTAPSNAANATLTVTVLGQSVQEKFKVVEPSGVDHAIIVETNFPDAVYNLGEAGAGMHLHVFMKPTDVSFYKVWMEEVGEDATNVTGYFTNTYPAPSHIGNGADTPFALNEMNRWDHDASFFNYDYCYSPTFPTNSLGNWSPGGSYTWNIPWNWWVDSSVKHSNATGWQQVFTLDSAGTVKITKFNSNWVQRTTSGVITNSP